jgi:TetR/AcrR family transcriptional regulator, transcriptional repressor for nem operon
MSRAPAALPGTADPGVTAGRLTPKGRATRARIVAAASELMLAQGAARTTVEDIRAAAGVSTSQLYHYFDGKDALVMAVIGHQEDQVLGVQRDGLGPADSLEALERWRDHVVATARGAGCAGGCPLGSLASDLAENDPVARVRLSAAFDRWEAMLRDGLGAMRDRGELPACADPGGLAVALLAAVQGGLLLSQVRREAWPLEAAVDTVLARVRDLAARAPGAPGTGDGAAGEPGGGRAGRRG